MLRKFMAEVMLTSIIFTSTAVTAAAQSTDTTTKTGPFPAGTDLSYFLIFFPQSLFLLDYRLETLDFLPDLL